MVPVSASWPSGFQATLCDCEPVELWLCGTEVLWDRGSVGLKSCGPVVLWSCGTVVLWD